MLTKLLFEFLRFRRLDELEHGKAPHEFAAGHGPSVPVACGPICFPVHGRTEPPSDMAGQVRLFVDD